MKVNERNGGMLEYWIDGEWSNGMMGNEGTSVQAYE